VAGALAVRPHTVDSLCDAITAERRKVLEAVADLRSVALCRPNLDDPAVFELVPSRLAELAAAISPAPPAMDRSIGYGMTDEERDVLGRYFSGRTLREIPVNRASRRVVLERLALEFEIGESYTERQVVDLLRRFHPDHAALRRYLVDGEFLDRTDGRYWRAGGRVDIDSVIELDDGRGDESA
ncbi:MAG: DUF2087 domain-containing protein, partial [Actinomycetota bacterium]